MRVGTVLDSQEKVRNIKGEDQWSEKPQEKNRHHLPYNFPWSQISTRLLNAEFENQNINFSSDIEKSQWNNGRDLELVIY